jgi:hypothetical protein
MTGLIFALRRIIKSGNHCHVSRQHNYDFDDLEMCEGGDCDGQQGVVPVLVRIDRGRRMSYSVDGSAPGVGPMYRVGLVPVMVRSEREGRAHKRNHSACVPHSSLCVIIC